MEIAPPADGAPGPGARFIITGAPGTGKTALVEALGPEVHGVAEPAREVLAEQRSTGGSGTPDRDASRFVSLLLQRSIEKFEAVGRTGGPVLFDRGIPDCVAYAVALGTDPAPSVAASDRYRYHRDVLILEPWEEIYTVDDERTISFPQVVEFHEAIVDAYERTGYTRLTVPLGAIEERARFVRSFLLRRTEEV
jgi:predicted ATPase